MAILSEAKKKLCLFYDGPHDSNAMGKSAHNGGGLLSVYDKLMNEGNTVGSKFVLKTAEDFYIVGLWLADGYWRSSSVGLTSVNPLLIERFKKFLIKVAPSSLIKERVYEIGEGKKRKQTAKQIYVNNRPLTRSFMLLKTGELKIPDRFLSAYIAGRIDGDGCYDTKYRSGIRIAYANKKDALRDRLLFGINNVSLYHYLSAGTYVLYLRKFYRDKILTKLRKFSVKIAP